MPALTLGPFALDQKVSGGANGDVWSGTHVDSGLPVAVKVLKAELALKERAAQGFRNEVRAMAALHHPHIATVFDQGTLGLDEELASGGELASGCPYLVMEWASGGTLADRPPPRTYEQLLALIEPLLSALGHAHARGVIHRDLKPANVLFCSPEDLRPGLKLADFGLAVKIHPERDVRRLLGTPHYMAPEQWRAHVRNQGPWTDLYALACLVYRICTGNGPFVARSIKEMRRYHLHDAPPPLAAQFAVPSGFQDWLNHLLEKRPEMRPSCAAEALEALPEHEPHRPSPLDQDDTPVLQSGGLGLYGLRTIPLVDREPQRVQLWSSLEAARTQGLQVVVLEGPAGCGKSRLAEWLCVAASDAGRAGVLRADHGPTADEGTGFGPMVSRAIQSLGLEEDHEALRARVVEWLLGHSSADPFEVEALSSLVARGRARSQGRVQLNTQPERLGVVGRVLERECKRRPQILWIDDAQWAPEALALLERLAIRGLKLPLMVVATVQSEALQQRMDTKVALSRLQERLGPRMLRMEVGPLDPQHGLELARRLLGMDPELTRELAQLSEGNPLYAVQLVAEWVDEQLLEESERGYRLLPEGRDQLPDSLSDVWSLRLRSLLELRPEDDRRALEIAAVLGHSVDPNLWRTTCERAWAIPSEGLVEDLLQARLARSGERGPEEGWSFVHAMLRESLLQDARAAGRIQAHARLGAEALRQLEGDPDRIARLLELGGLPGAAASELQKALNAALSQHARTNARQLLLRLWQLLETLEPGEALKRREIEATLSAAWLRILERRSAEDLLRTALRSAVKLQLVDRQVRALTLLAEDRLQRDLPAGARKALLRAARLDAELSPQFQAHLEHVAARLLTQERQFDKALRRYGVAARMREEAAQPELAARVQLEHARVLHQSGQPGASEDMLLRVLDRFEDLGCLVDAARTQALLGDICRKSGRLSEAQDHYRKALARLELTGQDSPALRRHLLALAPD